MIAVAESRGGILANVTEGKTIGEKNKIKM
jgi:hypothetical protein